MAVFHIRLINGDEILTEIVNEDTTAGIICLHPYVIEELKSETGHSTIILSKYLLTPDTENALLLKRDHIVTKTSVHDEIIKYYENSKIYNKQIEEQKIAEIKRVNDVLVGINNQIQEKVIIKNVEKNRVHAGSNTVH